MANINRDYLIINDVKKSNVSLDNGSISFYITDKNTQNIFVNLVINISDNQLIQKYANVENAEDYTLTMHIVKPDNTYEIIQGKLHDKANAIFEFDLPDYCCDKVGSYRCELLTKCYINDREEITTSNKITYKVKSSVLNDLDEITEAPEYPLVIQLFDKLSDIEQYEEDRRANELARQLAEEQRQTRFNVLNADMADSIEAMDNKVVDIENRVSAKEQAVDKLIVDTKANIDNYKVAKDQEIDDYKTAKDTEINNAITNQDNKIDTAINAQNDRITIVENNDVVQDNRLDVLETKVTTHEARITATETKNAEQDGRLDVAENRLANIGNDITNTMQPIIDEHTSRLDAIEAIDVSQNNRLEAIESKNTEQDNRLLDIEKVNKQQAVDIKCLYGASQTIDITKEGNSIYLQNSNNGFAVIDEIKGNTLVNCNKEPDKELILNGNINTSGDNTVTLTEGVDGGLVDVALEGNTLVNVSKTKDSTAITKTYTVENSGNHIALQGDTDGTCRPVITGNTLVNLCKLSRTSNNVAYLDNPTRITGTVTIINAFKSNKVYANKYHLSNNGYAGAVLVTSNVFKLDIPTGQYLGQIYDNVPTDFIPPSTLISDVLILEGDYTNKIIPDYFEGLQSTFEDNLVTQEMVDNGEEVADNLGKYKVEYKATGKNKFDINRVFKSRPDTDFTISGNVLTVSGNWFVDYIVPNEYKGKTLTMSYEKNGQGYIALFKYVNGYSQSQAILSGTTFVVPNNTNQYRFVIYASSGTSATTTFSNIQLEEGDTATEYEPYKEYTKTLYLNSPPLEGDTIEEKDGGIYHVHRSELVAYTEGDETSLITDKVNTLHQLEIPQYELIEQSNLAIPSYANGHLDLDSAVPVERVEFKPFSEELTYLYANTQYTVQFISDKAITANIALGGTQLLAQSIVAGLNRIAITTPATLTDNKLVIDGVGPNITEVVVTDTDRKFDYFEGMKSVGEGGNLVITSSNSDNSVLNTQQLPHEPLRAVGDVKDRYVSIDGKWYIERKCGEVVLDGSSDEVWGSTGWYTKGNYLSYVLYVNNLVNKPNTQIYCDNFKKEDYTNLYNGNSEGICTGSSSTGYIAISINKSRLNTLNVPGFRTWLSNNPTTVIYQLKTPTYEPIDYNPLEVYSGTTHISINSSIPTNITIKNHGFNCLLKPSTTYTISSNLGLNTVTTPSTLTEDCLRFMDTDTSDVTTMRGVLVLEGDWTTKADLIPANFSGIESAFEQEYDAEKGKYKVNVKVANEDKTKENNITFYINEPLRGVGTTKDKVYVKDDKVVVQRNCSIRAYEVGDFDAYPTDKVNTVYPLAEPTYEEIEYNDTKLFIESFKNSTLFYNSNVPVTSTVHYSYSVPIVDTVAQTANISDQQDSMIIDLATQVAVMEMMLM